ncbi:MAG TPA: S-methyl-5-thioribose-1-phosphate isomerase [Tepidisphaeraceae bacterium]|nr:S-methyl-5-thioribose-1-phosphate isomerase [Tepidisphaeraceae bacterium]
MLKTLQWTDTSLRLLDQTRLPAETVYINCTNERMVWDAIRCLAVRGAPAIGVAAGYGAFLSISTVDACVDVLREKLHTACDYLATSRPTAVNLFWALDRIKRCSIAPAALANVAGGDAVAAFKHQILDECRKIEAEDIACCQKIGQHGLAVLQSLGKSEPLRILTHCNAGALATAGIGTALAPLYWGHERGVKFQVFADETRPLLQGARLTAHELAHAGIPVTVLCDNMAASLMSQGKIDAIIVGADRIAANGDTANKIGTHGVAIIARHFGAPFFVAAPTSTIDLALGDGTQIPIEHRDPTEVMPQMMAGATVFNPAFDVTPAALITAWITENGLWQPGQESNLFNAT